MNRERWLEQRQKGIGASDAACILGLNPWKSNVELWEEKTGRRQAPDLDANPAVRYGKHAEAPLRELFALDFPQYRVEYDEFGMIANRPGEPWLFATLDGELTETETGRKGVLEIKTTEIMRQAQWSDWNRKLPQHYYCQILHQLLATGYDFAAVKAYIRARQFDGPKDPSALNAYTRHYFIELTDNGVREGMDILLEKEIAFMACVQKDAPPPLILPPI